MTVCPHCIALTIASAGVVIPFIPSVLRSFKEKFRCQTPVLGNLGTEKEVSDGR